MAKLAALPATEVIMGFKGSIDYYVHRGINCARRWPRKPQMPRSSASQLTSRAFSYAGRAGLAASAQVIAAYRAMAVGQPITWRDNQMRAYFGRLVQIIMVEPPS